MYRWIINTKNIYQSRSNILIFTGLSSTEFIRYLTFSSILTEKIGMNLLLTIYIFKFALRSDVNYVHGVNNFELRQNEMSLITYIRRIRILAHYWFRAIFRTLSLSLFLRENQAI